MQLYTVMKSMMMNYLSKVWYMKTDNHLTLHMFSNSYGLLILISQANFPNSICCVLDNGFWFFCFLSSHITRPICRMKNYRICKITQKGVEVKKVSYVLFWKNSCFLFSFSKLKFDARTKKGVILNAYFSRQPLPLL